MHVLSTEGITFSNDFKLSAEQFPATVGRSDEATVYLDDAWVSRLHCCFEIVNGLLMIRDLDSRNGTIVNGQRVKEAVLMEGDELLFGRSGFRIRRIKLKDRRSSSLQNKKDVPFSRLHGMTIDTQRPESVSLAPGS